MMASLPNSRNSSRKMPKKRIASLQSRNGFAIGCAVRMRALFPGSSAVEQPAVNRLVAGSNPARGAKFSKTLETITKRCLSPQVPV